jgi:hypothetical protein
VIQLAYAWHARLWTLGANLEGPVRVASERAADNARQRAFAWPLAWELSELDQPGSLSVDSGRLVEDAADARKLRKLRQQALRADELASGIYVQSEDGARSVFVRSELPAVVLEPTRADSRCSASVDADIPVPGGPPGCHRVEAARLVGEERSGGEPIRCLPRPW